MAVQPETFRNVFQSSSLSILGGLLFTRGQNEPGPKRDLHHARNVSPHLSKHTLKIKNNALSVERCKDRMPEIDRHTLSFNILPSHSVFSVGAAGQAAIFNSAAPRFFSFLGHLLLEQFESSTRGLNMKI